jgi:tetrahydromethanopterin S-methyltransferase subunit G
MTGGSVRPGARNAEWEVVRAVARLKAAVVGLLFGLVAGITLFAMTAILIIENGPNTGAHLRLLSHYAPGYSVTWRGAFIGFGWAFLFGGTAGWCIGFLYNRLVGLRQRGPHG